MSTSYDFRIRFILPPGEKLDINSSNIDLSDADNPKLSLSAYEKGKVISDSKQLLLRGEGYESIDRAQMQGEQVQDLIFRAFSKLHIGADFGLRAPRGGAIGPGLRDLEKNFEKRLLDDVHGLMIFEHVPSLLFHAGPIQIIRGSSEERFLKAYRISCEYHELLTKKERLSYDLFSASYFENSQDARLLTLMMSYEVLLEPMQHTPDVLQHVEELISLTTKSDKLSTEQKKSFLGNLQWLKQESIGQAGRRLASERLGDRIYDGMTAEKYFMHCYGIRSSLVHGTEPFPTRSVVSSAAATFEGFVADILSGSLLEVTI